MSTLLRGFRKLDEETNEKKSEPFSLWPRWVYVENKGTDGRELLALGKHS
jgi:hypothetical protein